MEIQKQKGKQVGKLTVAEQIGQKHQEDLQRLRGFRLLDDDFLTKCFEGDTKSMELVLQSKEGIEIMCRAMEDMRKESLQEGIKEGAINTAKRMLADGMLTLEKIAEYAGLPLDEVKKLKAERTA